MDSDEKIRLDLDIKKTRLQFVATLVAAGSAFVAAVGAGFSAYSAIHSRSNALEVTRYSGKIAALRDYSSSFANFDASLRTTQLDLLYPVFSREDLSRLNVQQMKANAFVARRAVDAYGAYLSQITADQPLWSDGIKESIWDASSRATEALRCFSTIGAHSAVDDQAYWEEIKRKAAPLCEGWMANVEKFDNSSVAVIQAMSEEIKSASAQVR